MSLKRGVFPWRFGIVTVEDGGIRIIQLNSTVSLDDTGVGSLIAALLDAQRQLNERK